MSQQPVQSQLPRDVDRIREILFGPQIREYEQRFQNLHRDLERLQAELEHLGEQLNIQDGEQGKKLQALRTEMQKADNSTREELRQAVMKLTDEKVDRFALADLFIELGNQLKSGGSLGDLLKVLAPSD